ncbi:MAG: C-terminal binding protein [Hyphomonadaceae bacterium]|nr:C-terminal binding protein [Hyphomonadaceae bacterium]
MTDVLLTDYAWPDDALERDVIERAGFSLASGASAPAPAAEIEALVRRHRPRAIMTCWARVSADAIAAAPDLRIVQRLGVGLDNIDVAAATARKVVVTNVPDYCVEEVSDHAVGLALAWARGIVAFDRSVKAGAWAPESARLHRVRDLNVGIVGYGRIGRRTAEKLAPFGVRILAQSPSYTGGHVAEAAAFDVLLAASDIVIIHAPLTDATHHLFDAARIAAMKPGAFLINVSRGPIVDNAALLAALDEGRLAGAGLDVVESEPSPPPEIVARPDVIVTPHVAFSSAASLAELRRRAAEEVVRVLRGESAQFPCNAVN